MEVASIDGARAHQKARDRFPCNTGFAMNASKAPQVYADIDMTLSGRPVRIRLGVPAAAAIAQDLLPALRALTDANVDAAAARSVEQGRLISCRKGCGACCRQLVPITPAEARRLHEVVQAMPEPRRSRVRERFEGARTRFAATDMLHRVRHLHCHDETSRRALGIDYFRHGVACPFLEHESCSIYDERPLACREYLVTSPVSHCSTPSAESVQCVPMPVDVSRALGQLQAHFEHIEPPWVPLVLALEWAENHPAPAPYASGPALLEALFTLLGARWPPSPGESAVSPD